MSSTQTTTSRCKFSILFRDSPFDTRHFSRMPPICYQLSKLLSRERELYHRKVAMREGIRALAFNTKQKKIHENFDYTQNVHIQNLLDPYQRPLAFISRISRIWKHITSKRRMNARFVYEGKYFVKSAFVSAIAAVILERYIDERMSINARQCSLHTQALAFMRPDEISATPVDVKSSSSAYVSHYRHRRRIATELVPNVSLRQTKPLSQDNRKIVAPEGIGERRREISKGSEKGMESDGWVPEVELGKIIVS